ncbi:MAG: tetratricopeptide repeat protein [Acidobacteriota bacterium]
MKNTAEERWQSIKQLFTAALAVEASKRAAFLDQTCVDHPSLRQEVESLLLCHNTHTQDDGIFDTGFAMNLAATMFNRVDATTAEDPFATTPVTVPELVNNRYECLALIGEGGMGQVFKAKDLQLQRYVALKFLRGDDPSLIEHCLREAQAQASIEHEHICKVYEAGESNNLPYIAMQYIEGQPLKVHQHQLPLADKVKIMIAVAEAVHAAHKIGLIHRDLKPTNIMLEQNSAGQWRPFVMDFGLACDSETAAQTKNGKLIGTPAYMAPEQVAKLFGEAEKLDQRVDVYSLGVTLYELLTGQPPFNNGTGMKLLKQVLTGDAVPVRKLNRAIPLDLEIIVMKCLEKQPARRYLSAWALAEDLRRFAAGEPICARPNTFIYRAGKKASKHKALVAVSGAALALVLGLGGMWMRAWWMANTQTMLAQQFGEEVTKIEAIIRYGHMMPLHDITNEKDVMRAHINMVKEEMNRLGSVAREPGNYALGRGYLALGEYQTAREYLEKARVAGYRTPGGEYAWGLTLAALYQQELENAERIGDEQQRALRLQQIEHEYRDPALAALKASSSMKVESPEYVEGLIAFCEKRYEQALQKAEQAAAQNPLHYEARKLAGDSYLMMGNDKQSKGAYDDALADYERAGAAYEVGTALARSYPAIYEQDCNRRLQLMVIATARGESPAAVFDKALYACDQALQADSKNGLAYSKKAYAYWRFGEYQFSKGIDPHVSLKRAAEMAHYAIQYNPSDVEAYHYAGTSYLTLGKYERTIGIDPNPTFAQAIAAFQQALRINPNYVNAYNNLANLYNEKGRYDQLAGLDPRPMLVEAKRYYEKALQLNPNLAIAHTNLGNADLEKGRYEESVGLDPRPALAEAITAFNKSLQFNPNLAATYNSLGTTYNVKGRYEESVGLDPRPTRAQAINCFEKALQINANFSNAYNNLGNANHEQGRYEKSLGLDPRPSLAQAINCFHKAVQINPNYAMAYANLAEVYNTKGIYEQEKGLDPQSSLDLAIEIGHKALQINPKFANTYAMLSETYYTKAQYQQARGLNPQAALNQAIVSCQKAIAIKPNDGLTYLHLGKVYVALDEYRVKQGFASGPVLEKAREALTRAVQLNPQLQSKYELLMRKAQPLSVAKR